MIKYDSKTKVLKLITSYDLGNDEQPKLVHELSLANVPELEAQRLISMSKLVMGFCNGNKIDLDQVLKQKLDTGEVKTITSPSMLKLIQSKLDSKDKQVEVSNKVPVNSGAEVPVVKGVTANNT